jgi:diaminohydroxyphosphoribosylaminopyrimidine deaminase/5-amino-6-(5-phosphoribosylamino)uracil reductase
VAGWSEAQAMHHAVRLAVKGPVGVNPRVGCVILNANGELVGEGWHEGAGTAHAEVVALRAAGEQARGGTAVVTLEPCTHQGRTPPCVAQLASAGIVRVVYGRPDPNSIAAGGARALHSSGVDVASFQEQPLLAEVFRLTDRWAFGLAHGRPFVTWKFAATLDGRSAAADGSSRWITGPAARADVHRRRSECDAILVGTGTILADNPRLTVRDDQNQPVMRQPMRVVMGLRDLSPRARVLDEAAPTVHLRTRDPEVALKQLWDLDVRHVWLEGGPRCAAAFVSAGTVDEVVAYIAPALLGAGPSAVGDLGLATVADALRLELVDVSAIDGDIRIIARGSSLSEGGPA